MSSPTERDEPVATSMARLQHELSTPLSVASLATSVLGDVRTGLSAWASLIVLTAEQSDSLTRLLDSLEEAQTLAHVGLSNANMLLRLYGSDSARHADDSLRARRRTVNLRQCLERATRMLHLGDDAGMERCRVKVPEDLNIDTDEVAWYQICTNLIKNSLRHARVAGVAQRIDIGVTVTRDSILRFEYHDNGEGLSSEVRCKLVDDQGQMRPEWSGLGLGFRIIREVVHTRLNGCLTLPVCDDARPGFAARIEVPLGVRAPTQDRQLL